MSEAGSTAFDLVVLGGGSGGYAAAFRAAELGMSVALIEKDKLGGTCLHRGCIPTKALLHAGEVADQTRDSEQFGIRATLDEIDIGQVNSYKDGVVSQMYRGLQGLFKGHKIVTVEGEGRLTGPNTVQVGDTTYQGEHVLLATGSVPKSLPGLTIDGDRVISSDHAVRMDRIPKSVVILGGGVIGVEFASVWRSFGADVTIVEMLPHLLPLEDEASQKQLERAFRKRGIKSELGAKFEGVKTSDAGVTVSLEGGKTLEAEFLLVAVGRAPVSEGLGYEEQGVDVDRGFVQVDEHCRTAVPSISAVGDLISTLQLAHAGFAEGILVAERLGGLNPVPIDYAGVPRITYSNPEVASVGLTAAEARQRYGDDKVATYDYPLAGNGKSNILKTSGAVRLVRQVDGPVLGVHMVGERMGELTAESQLIYNWEALPSEVAQLIHPHPTQSEAIGEAHLALAGKPLHVH
ncbi:MAG: dihydrolipoyl dehydrogenase, partial [Streptosporangiales bacterium]